MSTVSLFNSRSELRKEKAPFKRQPFNLKYRKPDIEDETLFYKIYCKTQTHLDLECNNLTLNETQEAVLNLTVSRGRPAYLEHFIQIKLVKLFPFSQIIPPSIDVHTVNQQPSQITILHCGSRKGRVSFPMTSITF